MSYLEAATVVDFYSTQSVSEDEDMINMTTNLFYTQMQTLSGYTVIDKRETAFDESTCISSHIAFWAEIHEDNEGNWVCTLNASKPETNKSVSETKTYASYFKILTDAKSSLENLLDNINESPLVQTESASADKESTQNLDLIAGTWSGEDFIEKIILMRSGRGFIIFKNGASMNVLVSMHNKDVTITQNGKSNASFYPNLPREIAQKIALTANPLSWNLKLSSDNTLTGTKTVFIEDSQSENGATASSATVMWTKR